MAREVATGRFYRQPDGLTVACGENFRGGGKKDPAFMAGSDQDSHVGDSLPQNRRRRNCFLALTFT